jgi:nucleoside-diphosphate-sugar epimerase
LSVEKNHILITGGAGYIGSYLAGFLLRHGYYVTVVDDLLFGGESLLAYLGDPHFYFVKANVCESRAIRGSIKKSWPMPFAIVHLAAIAGFPACQALGRQVAWKYNVEATERVFEQGSAIGVRRFVYASSYSNYGLAVNGEPVNEESPLNPQSLYAETKIASERFLLAQQDATSSPLIFRIATLYGLSPRTRFDLIINQFVLEAYSRRELLIYQRGYSRSFLHLQDAVNGIYLGLVAPESHIQNQIFNLGTSDGNLTKDQIVSLILKRLPETLVHYKDMTFGGDMRDLTVSFEKIREKLEFSAKCTVDDGIKEILAALRNGIISNPQDQRNRNAQFIVQ